MKKFLLSITIWRFHLGLRADSGHQDIQNQTEYNVYVAAINIRILGKNARTRNF